MQKRDIICGMILSKIDDKGVTFTELSERVSVSTATLSKYLQKMEDDHLIFKELDSKSRPARILYKKNTEKSDEIEDLIRRYMEYQKNKIYEAFMELDPQEAKNTVKKLLSILEDEVFEDENHENPENTQ